ncbi:anhydro-N-acetylmuramic acid kinase [Microlunatus parietis]|uniref:Anhydro-N-acetylmuramic acid kinase n=1 Tax=Microlunatus parietis TaxID=682979 RepID=A0A7Y9L9M8_9ACTN|nr:anhydro-N-acetylmuramic acid kinase [Microlunatus parietis]NYE68730.1 anhydro-N-acetylmuramic acid kinase [Microlunatus parietis]
MPLRVIGMMSGTSFDAVDAAAVELAFDGDVIVLRPLGLISRPYPEPLRAAITAALPPHPVDLETVCRLDTEIGRCFADVAAAAVDELCDGRADLVASHGQTVYHWVEDGAARGTLQIGQPAWIAERTGLPVVADFRTRDIAAGGQGAPLVGLLDVLWLRSRPGNPVALNLGGIANITVDLGTDRPLAYDTGPANALLDAAVRAVTGEPYDRDGARAARGRVLPEALHRLLAAPYYRRLPPKSTGKELFHLGHLDGILSLDEDSLDDALATLTELTARTVAEAILRHDPTEVVAAGGGLRNPTLAGRLAALLGPVPLRSADELGLPSAAKEAILFALLGFLTVHGLPGTLPSTTGARHPSVLGSITPGRRPLRTLAEPVPPRALEIRPAS